MHLRRLVSSGLFLAPVVMPAAALAQAGVHPEPARTVTAQRLAAPVKIDGRLDEDVWKTPGPASDFRQSQPDEGKPATQKTEVRFAYDDQALYVGARMYDSEGAKGVQTRLLRRDAMSEADCDLLELAIDSYHSHTSSYFFWVNPSGSKRDGTGDPTWDPIWETATQIDSLGWTAEMRIPFNQLNFSREALQTWGIQIIRFEHRLNERSHFAWWPINEAGGPQRYAHLGGIQINDRPRGMEVVPYTVLRAKYVRPSDPANPYTKSNDRDIRVGGDLKYRLTSNLTLNATINPDFGQVEVDPAVVNLSAFETFFPEKRPFFIENANAFGFGNFSCMFCSNVSNLQMFYSRRIGRAPQLFPSATYVDQPENATILAAGKVTGRTSNNYLVGILDAVTRRETARALTVSGSTETETMREVEPLSNYFVARPRKDFRGGQYQLGAIATSVDRFTADSLARARLVKSARAVGFDWFASWKNRAYSFMGQYALSDLRGSTTSIDRYQKSSARYFQRPDRESGSNGLFSNAYDSNATRLTGYAGYARVAKDAGTWLWESMVNYRSPGFEVNDISFLDRADYLWMNSTVARSIVKPGRIFRNYFAILSTQQQFNYSGSLTDREYAAGIFGQLLNFWQLNAFSIRSPEVFDDRRTRGGPVVKSQGYRFSNVFVGTDQRRRISFQVNPSYTSYDRGRDTWRVNLTTVWKPSSNVQLSLGPSFANSNNVAQYVTSGADSTATAWYGRRYIFAELAQKSLSMSTRANVTFTPNLTLEVFAQPLISSADYVRFREYAGVGQSSFHDFAAGSEITSTVTNGARVYTVDVDGAGPAQPISFGDPNFNFRALRGNAVVRWEYKPGSTLFFVWQQNRSDTEPYGDFSFSRDRTALFGAHPDNIFLIKGTFWKAF